MQWVLQDFEDTIRLAAALDELGVPYTWHKVVPFVGDLIPRPEVADPNAVVLFGSYSLWQYSERNGFWPGVLKVRPFVDEDAWRLWLLNGPDARFMTVRDVPSALAGDDTDWFVRPVDDTKEVAGMVRSARAVVDIARSVLSLDESEIPITSLRHDTLLMLTRPVRIEREWRLWVVGDRIVTYSLDKEGARVLHRPAIDDDALAFGLRMVELNPDYAPAYVLDLCRTDNGLKILETNCINAAGLYAADLVKLATAIDALRPRKAG